MAATRRPRPSPPSPPSRERRRLPRRPASARGGPPGISVFFWVWGGGALGSLGVETHRGALLRSLNKGRNALSPELSQNPNRSPPSPLPASSLSPDSSQGSPDVLELLPELLFALFLPPTLPTLHPRSWLIRGSAGPLQTVRTGAPASCPTAEEAHQQSQLCEAPRNAHTRSPRCEP